MKNLTIERIVVRNFKGLKDLKLAPNGGSLEIRGDNGVGKTTVADAWFWLLFGRDSRGAADFAIKPLLSNGSEIHGEETSVEADIRIDGVNLTLRRTYREKWTKKRGEAKERLTGHTTDFAIDEVPVKKAQWEQEVSRVAPELAVKLLSDPEAFGALHWEKRRALLLEIVGDITDEDILDANPKLGELAADIRRHGPDDLRKKLRSQQRAVNKELEGIPHRIDEQKKSIPDAPPGQTIEEIEQQIAQLTIDPLRPLRKQVATAQNKVDELQVSLERRQKKAQEAWAADRERLERRKKEIAHRLADLERAEKQTADKVYQLTKAVKEAREEWLALRSRKIDVSATCPTCGQDLPTEQRDEAIRKAKAKKAEELKRVGEAGKAAKGDLERAMEHLQEIQKDLDGERDRLEKVKADLVDSDPPAEQQAGEELQEALADLAAARQALADAEREDLSKIQKTKLERKLQLVRQKQAAERRVQELKDKERDLCQDFEELERKLHLVGHFTRAKVAALEKAVDQHFELVTFKLFEQQINGGIRPTCEILVDGVPYGSGLNTGARLNAGLDIIRTLRQHYKISCPVWIDGAESITKSLDIGGQIFKLIVDENYQKLEVRHD